MPGKAVRPPAGSGFNSASKKRMQQRDFEKSEWTLVAAKEDLADTVGATLAVEAGQSPQGQNYIWTLIRGESDDEEDSNVFATDGSCRACTFPLTKATLNKEGDGSASMTCPSCGSKFSLDQGEVLEWLPGNGPIQWMAKNLNSNKEQLPASILPTRVSQAGRVYLRLPDGTLPITKTAADRAAELAGTSTAPQTAQEKVKAAQKKAAEGNQR